MGSPTLEDRMGLQIIVVGKELASSVLFLFERSMLENYNNMGAHICKIKCVYCYSKG